MRKYLLLTSIVLIFTLFSKQVYAQSVGINEDNTSPNPDAILDVKSITKGAILPRMSTVQRTAMSLNFGDVGMIVYDKDVKSYFYFDGLNWQNFNSWRVSGAGIYSYPITQNVGIGTIPNSVYKLYVKNDDLPFGLTVSADNQTNSLVTAQFIAVNSQIDATRRGIDITFPSTGGFGLKEGIRSIIHLAAGQTDDAYGLRSQINAATSSGDNYGLHGLVVGSSSTGTNYGVYAQTSGATNYAVYGKNTTGFGGYFDGKVAITKNVGIGQTDANTDVTLDVTTASNAINIDSYNDYDGSNPKWGIYNLVSADGAGGHYGIFNKTFSNASATAPSFGSWNEVVDNGTSDTYGLFAKTNGSATGNNWAGYFDGKVQIINGTSATLPNDGYLMLGQETGKNLVLDNTRIIARDNGAATNLFLNPYVGDVVIGSPTNSANFRLNLAADSGQDALRVSVGLNAKLRVLANGGTVLGSNITTNIPTNGLYVEGNVRLGYNGTNGVGYKLAVDGKILGEEVRIEDSGNWPDYVFDDEYQLKTLEEVEAHINQYSHLPGIPTAAQVEADGILVGEMQKRMMEKIEELTLYMIDLKKENEALKARIEIIESK